MEPGERLASIVDRIQDRAGVDQVYGDPVARDGKTVVPVARVAYGFGGGYGLEPDEGADQSPAERRNGEGGGVGGGVWAAPTGVVEITDEDTRFVRFGETRARAILTVVGFALGYVLGRRRGSDDAR